MADISGKGSAAIAVAGHTAKIGPHQLWRQIIQFIIAFQREPWPICRVGTAGSAGTTVEILRRIRSVPCNNQHYFLALRAA